MPTDKEIEAAQTAFVAAINDMKPCERCSAKGYHHGFGETGHDPDWCSECGGSGFISAHNERSAMAAALTAAEQVRASDGRSTLARGDEIERNFYQLKAQEWACEPDEAKRRIGNALAGTVLQIRNHC